MSVAVEEAGTSFRPRESLVRRGLPYAMVGFGVVATVVWNGWLAYLLILLVRRVI
jgi:hypothetical protein